MGIHSKAYLQGLISPSVYVGNDLKNHLWLWAVAVIELYQITWVNKRGFTFGLKVLIHYSVYVWDRAELQIRVGLKTTL